MLGRNRNQLSLKQRLIAVHIKSVTPLSGELRRR
jgi:hypothetical protein